MITFAYPAAIEEAAPGEFLITFRDIPEVVTGGADRAEAISEACDALALGLESYALDGRPLPEPTSPHLGEEIIDLAPIVVARLALLFEMARQGLSHRVLADRLGKDEKHVRRILAGKANFEAAVEALRELGVRARMTVTFPAA